MFRWVEKLFEQSAELVAQRILQGIAPDGLRVKGRLQFGGSPSLRVLPRRLKAQRLVVSDCENLRRLPEGLECEDLLMERSGVECLPPDLKVSHLLDARDCKRLQKIAPLKVEQLRLRGCTLLRGLPEGLMARRLDVSHCQWLTELPDSVVRTVEELNLSNCVNLVALPDDFARLDRLDASGCSGLTSLPDGIRIRSALDLGGARLSSLPYSLKSVRILWRGVPVSDRVAFDPESITVEEIFETRNLESRRVLLERVGMEWFVANSLAVVLDVDEDAGGQRRLLRIPMRHGEDIVCVEVRCPSTGKRYVLRVPPWMQYCEEAVAWTAGFNSPIRYRPALET